MIERGGRIYIQRVGRDDAYVQGNRGGLQREIKAYRY